MAQADVSGHSLRDGLSSGDGAACGSTLRASIPSVESLEERLQRLLVEKGIRQITLLEPDEIADARFSIVRIGYEQRGFGATISEAYADCKGMQ